MEDFLSGQSNVASIGTTFVELSCLSDDRSNSFVFETSLYGFVPLVLMVFAGISAFLQAVLQERNINNSPKEVGGEAQGNLPRQSNWRAAWTSAKSSATGLAAVLFFVLQPYLVERFALIFSCVKLGEVLCVFFSRWQ
jgi:hypothetical protein